MRGLPRGGLDMRFEVTITLSPAHGYTWDDVDSDFEGWGLGQTFFREYSIDADEEDEAQDLALDIFHGSVPIENLDAAYIDVVVNRKERGQ